MDVHSGSDKENSTPPGYCHPYRHAILKPTRQARSSDGRPRLNALTRSPSRSSYHDQMAKHWAQSAPKSRNIAFRDQRTGVPIVHMQGPRGAEPRNTLCKSVRQDAYRPYRRDSAGVKESFPKSSAPTGQSTLVEGRCEDMKRLVDSTSSSDEGVPVPSSELHDSELNDIERALVKQFDSPSPTREERRKTLYIPALYAEPRIFPDDAQGTSRNCPETESSSESWTGDDVFLKKPAHPTYRQFPSTSSAAPRFPSTVRSPAGAIRRSPLRQAQTASELMVQTVVKSSRFRVAAPMPVRPSCTAEQMTDHMSSDADDEDDGDDDES